MNIIDKLESNVRSYCRSFPTVFDRAEGANLYDESGRAYLDFFAGAGVLSYGHNEPHLQAALIEWIQRGGITHGLDMTTTAKVGFLEALEQCVLMPRDLNYKVMFPGPTGTNSVEAALKLARKVTGRTNVVSFTDAFHGMTLGSLAVTGNASKRGGAGVTLHDATRMPFCGYFGDDIDTLQHVATLLEDTSSGIDAPAAFIVETVQAEGGVNVASFEWLKGLSKLAKEHGSLLIIDDIQVGCGRTGPFFSFEQAGIKPDIVCLSKALSGFGLPMAVTLFRPELDQWSPGEHNGTFRGNNHAFVTAAAALRRFWSDDALTRDITRKAEMAGNVFRQLAENWGAKARGRGLIQGLEMPDPALASEISAEAFERGLIIETAGPKGEVVKLLPPLTISEEELARGLDLLTTSVKAVMGRHATRPQVVAPEAA